MRRTWALAAAALIVGLAACGSESEVGTGRPQEGGSTTTAEPSGEPDPTIGPPTLAEVGLEPSTGCDPRDPVHAVAGVHGGEPTVVGAAPPEGASVDVLARQYEAPDTDGDGAPDEVANDTGRVEVRRGDGTVTITRQGGSVGSSGGLTWIGDLDGDGRDELVVYATDPEDVGALELYLVPGTVPAGDHDPADVGVLLPWQPNNLVVPAGDHDGDGHDDVLVPGGSGAIVVAGETLLAPGPGGELGADSLDALREAPTDFIGVLELAPDVPPVFVTATDTGGDPRTRIEVAVLTDPPVRLRIGGLEAIGGGWGPFGTASGYRSGEHRIVVYEFSGGRSGYGASWYWDLDGPCGP